MKSSSENSRPLTVQQTAALRHFPKDGKWRKAPFWIKVPDYFRRFYRTRLRSATLLSLVERGLLECRGEPSLTWRILISLSYTSFAWEWRRPVAPARSSEALKLHLETVREYAPAPKSELDRPMPF